MLSLFISHLSGRGKMKIKSMSKNEPSVFPHASPPPHHLPRLRFALRRRPHFLWVPLGQSMEAAEPCAAYSRGRIREGDIHSL